MRRLVAILVAALFSTVTFAAYAADDSTQGTQPAPQKQAKKKKKSKSPTVSQTANPMDKSGQGAAGNSGKGGVQAGAPAAEGRATPGGAPAAGGGGVSSPTPKGAGRSDNQ